jgi:hypothetical protein
MRQLQTAKEQWTLKTLRRQNEPKVRRYNIYPKSKGRLTTSPSNKGRTSVIKQHAVNREATDLAKRSWGSKITIPKVGKCIRTL